MLHSSCLRTSKCRGTLWTRRIQMHTSCAFRMLDHHSQGQDHRELLSTYGVTLVPHARPEGMTSAGPKQTPAVMTTEDLAQVASISPSDSFHPVTPFNEPAHWTSIEHCSMSHMFIRICAGCKAGPVHNQCKTNCHACQANFPSTFPGWFMPYWKAY